MDNFHACDLLRPGGTRTVRWVSPIVSTMLSASRLHGETARPRWNFSDSNVEGYAKNNGLIDAISFRYQAPSRGGSQGTTYTKLTQLSHGAEVDYCNAIVGDLLRRQLAHFDEAMVGRLCKVVGELHDNVASHARGAGYSAAQVYHDDSSKRVAFAVADAGCGMLRNVRRVSSEIVTDVGSIEWCVQKGNTTAGIPDDDPFAQRMPDDSWHNPFPEGTSVLRSEDHHAGEGLWLLHEFVRASGGSLWICSGTGRYSLGSGGEPVATNADWHWQGVAVEFEIRVSGDGTPTQDQQAGLENLARRLGLS